MDVFALTPPPWTEQSIHAKLFCCPTCRRASTEAQAVWLNRRSPVYTHDQRKKWQEFYHCECGTAWWAWSDQRPPNEYADRQIEIPPQRDFLDFDLY
jgi:hypothetical protein